MPVRSLFTASATTVEMNWEERFASLVTGNFRHHVPDVLDERQQRRDREALDVAVRAIVEDGDSESEREECSRSPLAITQRSARSPPALNL
jgi:hypothetical protein